MAQLLSSLVRMPKYGHIFKEKLRLLIHEVGHLSRKGIARRALLASGGRDAVGGIKLNIILYYYKGV